MYTKFLTNDSYLKIGRSYAFSLDHTKGKTNFIRPGGINIYI